MNQVSTPEAIEMLEEISGIDNLTPKTEFGQLNLDSLQVIEWISMLEDKLEVELNVRDLNFSEMDERSIDDVMDVIRSRSAAV